MPATHSSRPSPWRRALKWFGARVAKDPGRAVIVPPAGPGSLGDDAMMRALMDQLARIGVSRITILECVPESSWHDEPKYRGTESLRMGRFFAFAPLTHLMLRGLWVNVIRTVFVFASSGRTYFIGADIMDGHYGAMRTLRRLWLARLAADLGSAVTITGFSWNDQAHPGIADELRSLSDRMALHVRDEISLSRLRRDAPGIRADLTSDLAFLLRPTEAPGRLSSIEAWSAQQRSAGRTVIAVNFGFHTLGRGQLPPGADGFTRHVLAGILAGAPEASLLFIPHDRRGSPSDFDLASSAVRALSDRMAERVIMLPATIDAADVKAAVVFADIVISQRMHLAIAAAGQSVPVACIVYQGKFEGFFRHLGINDLTLSPEDASEAQIADLVRRLLSRREPLRRQLAEQMPAVRQMALGNL